MASVDLCTCQKIGVLFSSVRDEISGNSDVDMQDSCFSDDSENEQQILGELLLVVVGAILGVFMLRIESN